MQESQVRPLGRRTSFASKFVSYLPHAKEP